MGLARFRPTIAKAPKKKIKIKQPPVAERRLPFRITNVTTTAWLGVQLDLVDLSETLICMYHREKFPNAVYQVRRMGVTILLYESGKIVTTGSKTWQIALNECWKLVALLRERLPYTMWDATIHNFKPVNWVGSFSTGFLLNLPLIKRTNPNNVKYNVHHFPAARYPTDASLPSSKIAAFRSGQVNISGAQSPHDLVAVYHSLKNQRQYRMYS